MIHKSTGGSWNEVIKFCADLEKNVAVVMEAEPESVVIFGAGAQGRIAARYLKKLGLKIRCFADNDPGKQGTLTDGKPVVPPNDPSVVSAPIVLIATRNAAPSVRRQLDELKTPGLSFDAFFAAANKERFSHVRNDLLYDDRSRLSYDAILKTILTGDNSYCASVAEENQYFALPEFINIGNDHFVDAGAYVGDTLEKYIWRTSGVFKKIYAFEPGEPQFKAMKHRVERLCKEWAISQSAIICENAGLSHKNGYLTITESSVHANMSLCKDYPENKNQSGAIFCHSLDNYLAGRPATFIKADIEGMELDMLRGAEETIRRHNPKMALSIYHNPAHLFEIAEYVSSLTPGYHMAVRQHSPVFAESVLYCWIP